MMTSAAMSGSRGGPFSVRTALALIVFGTLVFVALLWMIGAGLAGGSTNDGGGHAAGKGLNGFAALSSLLERRGYQVRQTRTPAAFDRPGLLVLTPPHNADGAELERIVGARRAIGPTLIVTPKWLSAPASTGRPGAQRGWVELLGAAPPVWRGFLDDVTVKIEPMETGGRRTNWSGGGLRGALPVPGQVQSGLGARLVPLVVGARDGRFLAAYVDDGGSYPGLRDMAVAGQARPGDEDGRYPIVLVFEPDLVDNYGFARQENALLALALVDAAMGDERLPVNFDLLLNGHGRTANLLTLAFSPPFLAATLCLLLAALVIGWRAFLRFGAPRQPERAIAFGKQALVANASGLLRRARRLHLIGGPYVDRARERIARALALPRSAGNDATDAAIDRVVSTRSPDSPLFTVLAQRLRSARSPHDIVRAARALHALERTLIR